MGCFKIRYKDSRRNTVYILLEEDRTWRDARDRAKGQLTGLLESGARRIRLIGPGGRSVDIGPKPAPESQLIHWV